MNCAEIKETFIAELSGLVDEYAGSDEKTMRVLEDFTWRFLTLVDSCRDDVPTFFLGTHDGGGCILSGSLHHDILRYRMGKNKSRRGEMRKSIKQYLKGIRESR